MMICLCVEVGLSAELKTSYPFRNAPHHWLHEGSAWHIFLVIMFFCNHKFFSLFIAVCVYWKKMKNLKHRSWRMFPIGKLERVCTTQTNGLHPCLFKFKSCNDNKKSKLQEAGETFWMYELFCMDFDDMFCEKWWENCWQIFLDKVYTNVG